MKQFTGLLLTQTIPLVICLTAKGQELNSVILITGAKIFDGKSPESIEGNSILIEGNTIK